MVTPNGTRRKWGYITPERIKGIALAAVSWLFLVNFIQAVAGFLLGKMPLWTAILSIPGAVVSIPLLLTCNRFFREAQRHITPTLSSINELEDKAILLYLRPFGQDMGLDRDQPISIFMNALRAIVTIAKSEEQHVVEAIAGRQGQTVVAAARPGESLPRSGATRVLLSAEDWQNQVRELLSRAERVALVIGASKGVLWEFVECMRVLRPERLILIVAMNEREYRELARVAEDYIVDHLAVGGVDPSFWPANPLPSYSQAIGIRTKVRGVVYFEHDWTPRYRPLRRYSPIYSSLRGMLLRAIPPNSGRATRSYMIRPPKELLICSLLVLVTGAFRWTEIISTATPESFFLDPWFVLTAIQLIAPIVVAILLARGTPSSSVAALAYFSAILWIDEIFNKATLSAAFKNLDTLHYSLYFGAHVMIPAVGAILILSRNAKNFYSDRRPKA